MVERQDEQAVGAFAAAVGGHRASPREARPGPSQRLWCAARLQRKWLVELQVIVDVDAGFSARLQVVHSLHHPQSLALDTHPVLG